MLEQVLRWQDCGHHRSGVRHRRGPGPAASRRARLALLDLNGPAVAATARQCEEAGAQARTDTVDVTDHDSLVRRAATVAGELGHVDLLVCAAGVIHTGTAPSPSCTRCR